MPEILVSNMSLPWLAGLPVEYTGLVARSLGFDGVEHVPTKAGRRQIRSGKIGPSARIKSGHWSWRSEPYGKEGRKLAKTPAALFSIAFLPIARESEEYLTRLQAIINKDLPTVLYLEKLYGRDPRELPFTDKSVQITPMWLAERGIQSVNHLVDYLGSLDVNPCYDTVHSNELPTPIRDYVRTHSPEIHIGIDRIDMDESHGDITDLSDFAGAKRVVVETPNSARLIGIVRKIKDSLKN